MKRITAKQTDKMIGGTALYFLTNMAGRMPRDPNPENPRDCAIIFRIKALGWWLAEGEEGYSRRYWMEKARAADVQAEKEISEMLESYKEWIAAPALQEV